MSGGDYLPPESSYEPVAVFRAASDRVDTGSPGQYNLGAHTTGTPTEGLMVNIGKKLGTIERESSDLKDDISTLKGDNKLFKIVGSVSIIAAGTVAGWLFMQVGNIKEDISNVEMSFTKQVNNSEKSLSAQLNSSTEKILLEVKNNKQQINEIKLTLANNHPKKD